MPVTQVFFIDARVAGYQSLVAALGPDSPWFLLDAEQDGLAQISRILASFQQLEAISIISHGAPGSLLLGSTRLTLDTLKSHAFELQAIGSSLRETGDLLLYGCEVGLGPVGAAFLGQLAKSTGADVAASDDATGFSNDSDLEQSFGPIETTALDLSSLPAALAANTAPVFKRGDGMVSTAIGMRSDFGLDVALQADGKLVLAGYTTEMVSDPARLAVVRYLPTGAIDTSFGVSGKIVTGFPTGGSAYARSMELQTDGKVVLAGSAGNSVALVRYTSAGLLDTSFNGTGFVTTSVGAVSAGEANSLAIQADGKLVVAGWAYNATQDFMLLRYNSNGSLDNTFGVAGKVSTAVGSGTDIAHSVAIQADGRIVVAGVTYNGSNNDMALLRYFSNGSLDHTFGTGGKVITAWGSGADQARSVYVQQDGKILVAGSSEGEGAKGVDFALVRYNSDGNVDREFGWGGTVTAGMVANDAKSVMVQPDGKILLAGSSWSDFALLRYRSDGLPDSGFGTMGKVIIPGGRAQSVMLQPDGKIVVGGSLGSSAYDFGLVRYNSDGSLDQTFDSELILVDNPSNSVGFVENGEATLLKPAYLVDAELNAVGHYGGASVTLGRDGGAQLDDQFSGAGPLGPLTEGSSFSVLGTSVGSVTHNSAGLLTLSFNSNASQTLVNTVLQGIAYSNASDAPPASVRINWAFSDGNTGSQGAGGALAAAGSTTVNISATNDAPVLSPVNASLGSMAEDDTVFKVWNVATLLGGGLTDVDASALKGLALFGASGSYGKWQYNISTVGAWTDVGFVSSGAFLLLGATDLLRWVPDGSNGTSASLSYYGWDRSSGSAGSKVNATERGGVTPFSSLGDTATLSVSSAPDAPRLLNPIPDRLADEDKGFAYTLAANAFIDVDVGDSLSLTVSQSNGQALPAWLSFDPATRSFSGTPQSSDVGVYELTVTATDTANLSAVDSFRLTVNNVNDAPVLTPIHPVLREITEDDLNGGGQTIASLLGSSLSDVDSGASQGVALFGSTGSDGRWQYRISSGYTWSDVGAVSASSALLLRSTDLVRWMPEGKHGSTATLSYFGWDQTSGSWPTKVNASTRGQTTAFSLDSDTASLIVASVNDAPFFQTGDGIVTMALVDGYSTDLGQSVLVQPDGRILLAGSSQVGGFAGFALVRFQVDGSLDAGFNASASYTSPQGSSGDNALSAALQADGKVVLAGVSNGYPGNSDFAVLRYNADGSLDTSFSQDGKLTTSLSTSYDVAYGVVVQHDGKMVVAGRSVGSNQDLAVVRYHANGSLDTSFSEDGKVITPVGTEHDEGLSLALQPDGKILVAGSSQSDFALLRYNTDGSLDTSFSGDGILTTDIASSNDSGQSVTLQPDGKIIVAGYSSGDIALVRYHTDGSLDASFSGDGKLTTDIGFRSDVGYSLTLQPDGKMLVVGSSSRNNNSDFAVLRYNTDGSLDTGFSQGGVVLTSLGSGNDVAYSVSVQSDGKILVAGSSHNGRNEDFALVRYLPDGRLDLSFDNALTARSTETSSQSQAENGPAFLLEPDIAVSDLELVRRGDYGGASLTLMRQGGPVGEDEFSSGKSVLGLLNEGADCTVAGTVIGRVTHNGGGKLVLSFNSAATQVLVNQALQAVAYRNTSDAPPASALINWNFSDGNTGDQGAGGALSATAKTLVNITPLNDSPTGGVSISGTAEQGRTLTASHTLSDADGIPISGAGALRYQWQAGGADILGATAISYTLTQAEVGKTVTVSISYTDNFGQAERVTSMATALVGNVNDVPVGKLTISGVATQGQTLSATSTLTDADGLGELSYQWLANGTALAGATSRTLLLGPAQVGQSLSVRVSYTDLQGSAESVDSDLLKINTPPQARDNTYTLAEDERLVLGNLITDGWAPGTSGQTVFRDTDADGDALSLVAITVDGVSTALADLQNFIDPDSVPGAQAASTWKLISLHHGSAWLQASGVLRYAGNANDNFGDSLGYTVSDGQGGAASAQVRIKVLPVNDLPSGQVTLRGTATQGQTLTASHTLADADGIPTGGAGSLRYQWQAGGADILGAIESSYTLTQADVGKTVKVRVSYIDTQGTSESVSSEATLTVANVNDLPTGSVSISGTAEQGRTLTASHTLADADGIPTSGAVAIRYQWQAGATDIRGATDSSYTVTQAEVGKAITVTASYTDDFGRAETVSSTATNDVANVNDAPTGAVSISGVATQGQVLSASHNLVDMDGIATTVGVIQYQWHANSSNIAGATASFYTLTQTEVGKTIAVVVNYTDLQGSAESVSSAATTAVVANVNDAPTGEVSTSGVATQGQMLSASHSLVDADGIASTGAGAIQYQWQANGSTIAGATSSNYTLTQAEVGKAIAVVVSYTDLQGTAESVSSAATAVVANVNDAPTGAVSITGTATQGQVLSASHSLVDADGIPSTGAGAIQYQWQANGSTIAGATSSNYTLTQAEVGKAIAVVVSYTDLQGTAESVSSAATAVVANVNDAPTGAVSISGVATQGKVLSASHSLVDADGIPSTGAGAIQYQWQANGRNIAGATASNYTLTQAEVGKAIAVVANYTDLQGSAESMSSAATAVVANVNDAPTGAVSITGTATQGKVLSASHTLVDADGIASTGAGAIQYQWQANGSTIAGATSSNYTLTQAEVGKAIAVVASYTDLQGSAESVSSAATAVIAPADSLVPRTPAFWKNATQVPAEVNKVAAVNLSDAIAVLKMIVGLSVNANNAPLSPYQSIAADFDQNGSVELSDAIGVLKMVVGLSAPAPAWKYYDGDKLAVDYKATESLSPKGWSADAALPNLVNVPAEIKMVGVLTGDVDGSWLGS
jgi:uncharacterized delta-60 repeat protein